MKVLFILRGRPGLGHVIPGLAVAEEFNRKGDTVHIITYANGEHFLHESKNFSWESVQLSADYKDWPGLNLYDEGIRLIVPAINKFQPDLVVLGGEYLLPLIATVTNIPFAIMFNPEIMEDEPRNRIVSDLFCELFRACKFLIPIQPLSSGPFLQRFESLRTHLTPCGPFCFSQMKEPEHATILIGNGGGVQFPTQTDSYSSSKAIASDWLLECQTMTKASIQAALSATSSSEKIVVFSCLGTEYNAQLANYWRDASRLKIYPPSMDYYKYLHTSKIIVSRAGAGFLSDARSSKGRVIIWTLQGHDEQIKNAQNLVKRRKRTTLCQTSEALDVAIREAVRKENSSDTNKEREHSSCDELGQFLKNTENLVRYIKS